MAELWQNSPAMWLELGNYDGITQVDEVKTHGDCGVGAFGALHGEMVAIDGAFYRMTSDASAHAVPGDETLAFCMVSSFIKPQHHSVPQETSQETSQEISQEISHDKLSAYLDEILPDKTAFYLLRVNGRFRSLKTRCFPQATNPYKPFEELMKNQPEFNYKEIEGTMIGFRSPAYAGHIAPQGDHLHFISDDRTIGGHVLDFANLQGELLTERIDRQQLYYPSK